MLKMFNEFRNKTTPGQDAAFVVVTGEDTDVWCHEIEMEGDHPEVPSVGLMDKCIMLTGRALEQFQTLLGKTGFRMEKGVHILPGFLN